MNKLMSPEIIPNEVIVKKIYLFRGVKVMLDSDLLNSLVLRIDI